jgi:outer membrane receptor protein involved in Fe transport
MKKLIFVCLFYLPFSALSAQNPSKVTIKGNVQDTFGVEQPFATVMLLNPKDSALLNFTRGDDKGHFEFKNVKNTAYLLKMSFVGFIPFQQNIMPSALDVNDLGALKMKPITKELMEVVIRTAKAPLSIRGDTIEYNASSFKVPAGSTVEDLLRRLPGIEVDADGNIKAQGKDVSKLYVDGKTFFGNDPKAATKTLGAETISKVQVFNEKSEQAKLTGIDDGKKEKAMNLELKEEYKKGSFGKITAAVGTEERWAARGNYNRFNKTEQMSVLGFGNNINQTGVNWEDYGEFKGQNSFNNRDNGDFGFNNRDNWYYYGNNSAFSNNFDGRGFTNNAGAGTNYNFDNKKKKFNAMYFYNQTDLDLQQFASRQTFFKDSTFFNSDTLNKTDFRNNHSIATRYEQEIDSNNTIIAKVDLRFSGNDVRDIQSQGFSKNQNTLTNRLEINNTNNLTSHNLTSMFIYRHLFKKKGRSFAVSAGYNDSKSDGLENLFSVNKFFQAATFTEQIRQLNTNDNTTKQAKSSLLFTESLTKKIFYEGFYNFSSTNNQVYRQVNNPEKNNERIDNLSVFYDNDILYNRVGSQVRYSYQGINIATGLAVQQLQLKGEYSIDKTSPLLAKPIKKEFINWTPNVSANFDFKNNLNIGVNYNYSIREPQIADLQPVQNVNNPAFRNEGNVDLEPEKSHSISGNLHYFNPANFANFGFWSDYSYYDSQIAYNQTIEIIDKIGLRTTTKPVNVSGGNRFSGNLWGGFPIIKTKLNFNISAGVNWGTTPSFVNNVLNETENLGYNTNLSLDITPDPKLILSLRGKLGVNDISYSIQKEQNQRIINNSLSSSIKWNFVAKYFLESNFDYTLYRNDRFGFNRKIPIWNASIRRLFGKENKVELRLAAFDILNKRLSITQSGSQNFVIQSQAPTLARYFMLSATYNMKGHETKLKKNNSWF